MPLTADRPEDGDSAGIGVFARAVRKRYRLNESNRPRDRILARLADRSVDRDDVCGRRLDRDADVRILEIFASEQLRQLGVELLRRKIGRLDLSDLSVPGVPGSRLIKATTTSPIDTWRERG